MVRINIQIPESNHLPQDIIEEILSRLPVKSVLKFRCVSKSWCSLIGNKRFIKTHLQKSTKSSSLSRHRIIVNPQQDRVLMLVSRRSLWRNQFGFSDIIDVETEVNLVGCCNGLVCILLEHERLLLWNPSTRIAKNLPVAGGKLMGYISKYGFGYDECNDDYKVIVNITLEFNQVITRVYSLKTNSWETIKYEKHSGFHYEGVGTFASGNLHWVTSNQDFVSFDLKSEVDGVFQLPSYPNELFFPILGVIEGCLSVLCIRESGYAESFFDVWVMREYGVQESWVKVATLPNFSHNWINGDILSFSRRPNGDILVISSSAFAVYYLEDDSSGLVRVIKIDSLMEACFYVESLVSVASDADLAV